jgi:hypothetical protein
MAEMALLAWDEVTWSTFLQGLQGYRDYFSPKGREDRAYLRCLDVVQASPPTGRPDHSSEIVLLLNAWACRLSSERAPRALEEWLRNHVEELGRLDPLTILDPAIRDHAERLGELHDDLIRDMRAKGVNNMADAAASKTLHVLIPGLFVMWDKEIRRSSPDGYDAYLLRMHELAVRLAGEAPVPAEGVEAYLQDMLCYESRKTLAKYLDEYNWFEAVGRAQLAARAVKPA